ncbi:CNNM family magnesium/cobalt transport protein CorC [Paraglaciecola chathamensis]|jgi:magnesium and cobalt transporter|uniref:Magnesium and cobalt efflux protein CorC n=3 Tax=Paraglaciecola chathamensis TaxID=368405 RepID=A0A8H9IDE9_9ALTE|nr:MULTISPECIES: CNNM family magnesium/cobalt transport protein CorC [Paraglaciecola]AEE22998.1 CBS domain containing protein [Glaciecola sp. 4H-3-7+YE-5]MBN24400.1 magnesium/cobalt transporter CorC [Alteromonadaceae bacterium]MBJ2137136.1 CNNM family magnesium/cobalt transport protein CorC [Paraglaciecola chathamensis]MBU3019689.1 CNNM family magnesium/cobalt transport protein CorC [Paraglaciecola agarilytica]MDO6559507.1 CNNM family magnesium/cobalt transport protein CorC [Paraglaciecola cha|tara:strand:+ start:66045 stop:66905 length:861 start_codon:yes stop_codon:yes gene_type:complete
MSEDNPPSTNGSANKGWLDKIVQSFTGEPKSKDELFSVITDAEQREVINQETREMIEGVMEVSEMRVREIMIPRAQMTTIDITETVDKFLPIMLDSAHSRFPVISEDKDHIEGIILAKDLLKYAFLPGKEFELKQVLRPAVIVPESKRVDVLLKEFQQKRFHMAIVVDEYGGVSGLVTIEDILELIVGEIEDEHDAEDTNTDNIRALNKHTYSVKALTELEDFNEFFGTEFDEEEADTIGGIVLKAFGHMPMRDEKVSINGFVFAVTNSDARRLIQLKVTLPHTED